MNLDDAMAELAGLLADVLGGARGGGMISLDIGNGLVHIYVVSDDVVEPFAAAYRALPDDGGRGSVEYSAPDLASRRSLARARRLAGRS